MESLNFSTIILLLSFFVCNSITKNHGKHKNQINAGTNFVNDLEAYAYDIKLH